VQWQIEHRIVQAVNGSNGWKAETLCLECGMCCNGTIFADLKLQPNEDARRLNRLGRETELPVHPSLVLRRKISQPCPAFDGCRCLIYADRPDYCRHFACAVLKQAKAATITPRIARNRIRTARKQAAQVIGLLRELGDTDEHVALPLRMRRCRERLERIGVDGPLTGTYARLTQAFHHLTCTLAEYFYPRPSPAPGTRG
jgi:uncharacterized protein